MEHKKIETQAPKAKNMFSSIKSKVKVLLDLSLFTFSFVSFCRCRCLNACTYCKTKHARGDLASYPIEELVERARQSFQGEYLFSVIDRHTQSLHRAEQLLEFQLQFWFRTG